jgi:hypothetical protein
MNGSKNILCIGTIIIGHIRLYVKSQNDLLAQAILLFQRDGKTAGRIVSILENLLGKGARHK